MRIEVTESCPFEHSEYPRCCIANKDKEKFCGGSENFVGAYHGFAAPPDWCPLRKEEVIVKLPKKEK